MTRGCWAARWSSWAEHSCQPGLSQGCGPSPNGWKRLNSGMVPRTCLKPCWRRPGAPCRRRHAVQRLAGVTRQRHSIVQAMGCPMRLCSLPALALVHSLHAFEPGPLAACVFPCGHLWSETRIMGRGWFQRPPRPPVSCFSFAAGWWPARSCCHHLAWLEPGELLRPSQRSQLIAGLVGGGCLRWCC